MRSGSGEVVNSGALWRCENRDGAIVDGDLWGRGAADLKAADVMTDLAGAENLIESEEGAIAHMNEDHADAVRLYATKLLGAEDAAWRLSGLDPEGLDLVLGEATLRLPFPARVTSAAELRKMVVGLAQEARAKV